MTIVHRLLTTGHEDRVYIVGMVPSVAICEQALAARDPRFDGVFFVGITSTRVYCRPICPSRRANSAHRRFFGTAAAAEHEGFRPCLRCRPELAPGRARVDAVSRLARTATDRIAAGALNGRGVSRLARDLGVGERHLRRAVERTTGVSPLALAQTHRLLMATQLLADTALPVTQIAFASGFQSLRRFNSVFRERYRLSPTAVRGVERKRVKPNDLVRLTLGFRQPLAWDVLMAILGHAALPGVELVDHGQYRRTVRLDGRCGVVFVTNDSKRTGKAHLAVDLSLSLVPVIMPLLARLRRLFDLDAEPTVVDTHLEQGGLADLVARRPGIRVPGALDGFEVALGLLLRSGPPDLARAVVAEFGEWFATETPELMRLAPRAECLAEAGPSPLCALGASPMLAHVIVELARAVTDGRLSLEPGADVEASRRALGAIEGMDPCIASGILMRALAWPDEFPGSDPRAERWRPWRAYAALHVWLRDT
jgi:AraC family transcriptional regulator of adaptative response / DNA-3-methyladenine glycosylase II